LPGGGAGGGFPERSGSTAFARAEDAIVGGADVGFDAGVVDFFQSAAGAAAEGDEAEILFDIADGRKIEFPEIEILVEEGRAVGVETGLFADLADDTDVGFLVFFGPAEDELLFRGKFVTGENAGTVEAEEDSSGAFGEHAAVQIGTDEEDGDLFRDAGRAAHGERGASGRPERAGQRDNLVPQDVTGES
jgi:hypothetical protein